MIKCKICKTIFKDECFKHMDQLILQTSCTSTSDEAFATILSNTIIYITENLPNEYDKKIFLETIEKIITVIVSCDIERILLQSIIFAMIVSKK